MKRFITIALILFGVSITTHAADEEWPASSFQKTFSLEIGAGIMPAIHFLMDMYERSMDKSLKENGQKLADPTSYPPTFSLSAIWHTGPRWEMVVTGVISWWNYALYQLDSFGIGPDGKPRYDFSAEGTFVNDNTCYSGRRRRGRIRSQDGQDHHDPCHCHGYNNLCRCHTSYR